jgi:hypothetical protein
MSATGRGAERNAADFYPTPAWCVRRLLERVELPGGTWLEPAAGEGAIIRAAQRADVTWTAAELRHECRPALVEVVDGPEVHTGIDFLKGDFGGCDFSVVMTNPPFSMAMEFIEEALTIGSYVVMLLRVNFLGSAKRSAFFRSEMPDVYVLPNRPSFTGKGTDATEYCWAVWTPERGRRHGRVEVLAETPPEERR